MCENQLVGILCLCFAACVTACVAACVLFIGVYESLLCIRILIKHIAQRSQIYIARMTWIVVVGTDDVVVKRNLLLQLSMCVRNIQEKTQNLHAHNVEVWAEEAIKIMKKASIYDLRRLDVMTETRRMRLRITMHDDVVVKRDVYRTLSDNMLRILQYQAVDQLPPLVNTVLEVMTNSGILIE